MASTRVCARRISSSCVIGAPGLREQAVVTIAVTASSPRIASLLISCSPSANVFGTQCWIETHTQRAARPMIAPSVWLLYPHGLRLRGVEAIHGTGVRPRRDPSGGAPEWRPARFLSLALKIARARGKRVVAHRCRAECGIQCRIAAAEPVRIERGNKEIGKDPAAPIVRPAVKPAQCRHHRGDPRRFAYEECGV